MIIANPDLIKSSPSPLRTGLVGSRFTVVLYLSVVCFQFLVNFTVNGIVYLLVLDVTGQVDRAATNSALVMGVFLFVRGAVSTTVNIRASVPSDGSRPAFTAASYVRSIVTVGLGSLIWWPLTAIHPLLFVMGCEFFPLGVDSWVFVLFVWVVCDGAGRFIGRLTRYIGLTWKQVFVLTGVIPLGIRVIGAPATWPVLILVHESGYLPPMHPVFYLLGLISLTVIASGWPLTTSGHTRCVG